MIKKQDMSKSDKKEPDNGLYTLWYDKFKIGDTVRYDINVNYKRTSETKDFDLTEEILNNIKKYEDESNFHNMRVVN